MILLTNDDGIEARGLGALQQALDGVAESLVVAPVGPASGCSHRTTTDRPFRVTRLAENRHAVEGTPADCVRVGMHRLPGKIDWVISGINDGGNLGIDVYHSGTVAAAREAALHGIPGIAISQYRRQTLTEADWEHAIDWARQILGDLMQRPCPPGTFWNVNLPYPDGAVSTPEIIYCPLEPSPLPLTFREEEDLLHYCATYSQRRRTNGTDVEACFSGKIAVTEIQVMERSR